MVGSDPCLHCRDAISGSGELAGELYARDGSPCATCTCSYMSMAADAGTAPGFDMGPGLTLRVCRVGREPLVAESGAGELWCDDYRPFSETVPLQGDELDDMQRDCSRGFLGDLAQGQRPMPRTAPDLTWYDRGLREGWLPPHRIRHQAGERGSTLHGPWEQFQVIGVTPAFGDGHTPALGQVILQVRGQRSYLLNPPPDDEEVHGDSHPHRWWVSQVSSGAALPLDEPVPALRGARMLVLRGGEQVLSPHAFRYQRQEEIDSQLDAIADEALRTAQSAVARGDSVVADLCIRRGLRARPDHEALRTLLR